MGGTAARTIAGDPSSLVAGLVAATTPGGPRGPVARSVVERSVAFGVERELEGAFRNPCSYR